MPNTDYESGYRKPPKNRQFSKGTSGNPAGRPKGSKNFATIFNEVGLQKIKVTNNGVTREISKFEACAMQASGGDLKALNTVATWARIFQSAVDEPQKLEPDTNEADRAVMESILKRARQVDIPSEVEDL